MDDDNLELDTSDHGIKDTKCDNLEFERVCITPGDLIKHNRLKKPQL